MLRLEHVSKRHKRPGGEYKVALDDVSLVLDRGEIAGVFGPSGSGKTTLLRIAAGLELPDSGTASFDGRPLAAVSRRERRELARVRRQEVGCVWANQHWPRDMTALQHVALPLLVDGREHRGATRRAREALLACDAEQCSEVDFHDLSDGERQRVAIARALVIEPRLLLADAPVSHLSLEEQEGIMHLLAMLARKGNLAVLVTDNNDERLLRADPLLYLCDGRLVTPEPRSGRGTVLDFPKARSGRAAADA
jgi:ABC-type lipoprotein export system ATPase subunit